VASKKVSSTNEIQESSNDVREKRDEGDEE
jgi:hypothetical protein